MMKKRTSSVSFIVLLSVLVILYMFFQHQNNLIKQNISSLENGWVFSLNGKQESSQPQQPLASYTFPKVVKGDVVTLSRIFKEDDSNRHSISFDSWHSVTNVYLDNTLLYSWGEDYHQKGLMLGTARHSITLPQNYTGKTLLIELIATEDTPQSYLTSVAYYNTDDFAVFWFNRPVFLLFVGSVFTFLGICIIFITSTFANNGKAVLQPIMLGLTISFTGIYILARGNFLQVVIKDPQIYNAIEYLSLFLICLSLLLYWLKDANKCKIKLIKYFYFATLTVFPVFIVAGTIANFTTAIHLNQMLPLYYAIVICVCISCFSLLKFIRNSNDHLQKRIYFYGISTFMIGSLLSIVAFKLCDNAAVSSFLKLHKWYNYVLPCAMCVLVIFILLAFVLDMKQLLSSSYRNEFLAYAAYFDPLTQLFNRRGFDDDIKALTQNTKYGLISIDLNGLKNINDTLGHTAGDEMLKEFAILFKAACKNDKAYRLGGDEFAAIAIEENCSTICESLTALIDIYNKDSKAFKISAAIGMAEACTGITAKEVFDLADKQMYRHKKTSKTQL